MKRQRRTHATSTRSRRRRQCYANKKNQQEEKNCALIDYVLEEQRQLRQEVLEQTEQINLLKKQIESWCTLFKDIDSHCSTVADGVGAISIILRHYNRMLENDSSVNMDSR